MTEDDKKRAGIDILLSDGFRRVTMSFDEVEKKLLLVVTGISSVKDHVVNNRLEICELTSTTKQLDQKVEDSNSRINHLIEAVFKMANGTYPPTKTESYARIFPYSIGGILVLFLMISLLVFSGRSIKVNWWKGTFELFDIPTFFLYDFSKGL